jgi:hypothetical protein
VDDLRRVSAGLAVVLQQAVQARAAPHKHDMQVHKKEKQRHSRRKQAPLNGFARRGSHLAGIPVKQAHMQPVE